MKKVICVLLITILTLGFFPISGNAATNVIFYENGCYLTIELSSMRTRTDGYRTGNKAYTYHAADGTVEWKAVLTGSFTYTGSSAVCTASSMEVTIYNSAWYIYNKSTSKTASMALGYLEMGYKVLGVTLKRTPIDMVITCDPNGNLS